MWLFLTRRKCVRFNCPSVDTKDIVIVRKRAVLVLYGGTCNGTEEVSLLLLTVNQINDSCYQWHNLNATCPNSDLFFLTSGSGRLSTEILSAPVISTSVKESQMLICCFCTPNYQEEECLLFYCSFQDGITSKNYARGRGIFFGRE